MVEIVLPQECFGLLWIGSKAHVARQTVAIDFHVTAIGTLKRDATLSAVCHLEPRQTAIVADMGVMKQTMLQRNGRTVGSLIDDADSLAVWDILATVGLGLNDGEVVELGIATLQAFMVKGKESMARTLEGDELIREWHHATQHGVGIAIERIGILRLVVVVVANAAKVYLAARQICGNRDDDGVVGELFETAQRQGLAILHDTNP